MSSSNITCLSGKNWDPSQFRVDKTSRKTLDQNKREKRISIDLKKFNYSSYLESLRNTGRYLPSDLNQPILLVKPSWFNVTLFKHASSVYERHFMGINFAHLSGLLLLVRVDSIHDTLSKTGESDTVPKLFRRYYHTLRHVKTWYEGDIFDEKSEAQKSFLIVRGMHNKISHKFNPHLSTYDTDFSNRMTNKPSLHISKYDIMLTQFAFVGFIVCRSKSMGLLDDFNQKDLESLLHFWRVIGYYLGASDKFNLCSYQLKDIVSLCDTIFEVEYKEAITRNSLNSSNGIMSLNIIRSVKFIPMLTIYGMLRHLYGLLELNPVELDSKQRSWYSKLSFTLIQLVMTKLLALKPFRTFNNGLTRLSIYLVGKIEDSFANYLEWQYGSSSNHPCITNSMLHSHSPITDSNLPA